MSASIPIDPRRGLVTLLRDRSVYPEPFDSPVDVHETHISWVFLAGDYAYKVKKPIKTDFLDYSTLEKRERLCHEELRLDRRFAADLYLKVVPIVLQEGRIWVDAPRADGQRDAADGQREVIEYAVKMQRFPEDALLSHRLAEGRIATQDVDQLATNVATFHSAAERAACRQHWGSFERVLGDAVDNLSRLEAADLPELSADLFKLHQWTTDFADAHKTLISQRVVNGFVRECHGDMHLANVILWRGQMTPFDGIEFNDQFRWIDVLSDAAFLAMDFAARGRPDLGHSFINRYLEMTGDHASLPMLRWYLTYRALVRAKVAVIQASDTSLSEIDRGHLIQDCQHHVDLAYQFTLPPEPCIWITHGLSGSGKTVGSEAVIQQYGAIRFRSDIERKRHYGFDAAHRPNSQQRIQLYSEEASRATYGRLRRLAHTAIHDGFCVVLDATFTKRTERDLVRQLAESLDARFAILDFHADESILRKRVAQRLAKGIDASDADIAVLESQMASDEPLTDDEMGYVMDVSPTETSIDV